MRQVVDKSGQKIGKLEIKEKVKLADGRTAWKCLCECGNETTVRDNHLGKSKRSTISCGCEKSGRPPKHGMIGTRVYEAHMHMMSRCYNANNASYKNYGGRGITVYEPWHDFSVFYAYVGDRPEGMSLDRFPDNNGNYEPGNVRWATQRMQQRNKRNSRYHEYKGELHTASHWAEKFNLKRYQVENGISRGDSIADILENYGKI